MMTYRSGAGKVQVPCTVGGLLPCFSTGVSRKMVGCSAMNSLWKLIIHYYSLPHSVPQTFFNTKVLLDSKTVVKHWLDKL